MNLEKLNQFLTLLGNLGVVLGLVFLVIEIQNNTRATEGQTRDSMTERDVNWQMNISSNEFTASVINKGMTGTELSPAEFSAFRMLIQSNMRIWENEYYQYQQGLFTEAEFLPRIVVIEGNMNRCQFQDAWIDGSVYSPEFRDFVNGLISGPCQ